MNKFHKKLIVSLLLVCVLAFTLLLLASCGSRLPEPVNPRLNEATQTLMWNRVPKARGYSVLISGDEREKTLRTNSISLEHLAPGDYEIKIKAIGDGAEYQDSNWITVPYTRYPETGLRYKAIKNNTEYELIGIGSASGEVIMEDMYRGKPVTAIADKALAGNKSVTSFKVGKYVQTIGESAFLRCSELKSITFDKESQLTSIGQYAFQSCKKLESIVLPEGVIEIAPYTFSWCSELKTISLSPKTTTVGDYSFSSCVALEEIFIPDTATYIGHYAFADCAKMTTVTISQNTEIIGECAFYNCESINDINLGNAIKTIGQFAFGNCKKIAGVMIPESCTEIGNCAFIACESLERISIGSNLRLIGADAFRDTKYFTEYQGDIVTLGGWVLKCKNLEIEEIVLPEGIYGIANYAFAGCEKIENIDMTGIKYINDLAFAGCAALQTAFFDDSLLAIDNHAFYSCEMLRKIMLGENLETIGDYAFAYCSRIVNTEDCISLPITLKSIGSSAFYKTGAFEETEYGIVYIGDWAVDSINLGFVAYPELIISEGTRGIANYCCDKLMVSGYIYIGGSVEHIGKGAFYSSSFTTAVYLPANLKYIGDYAFYGCSSAMFGEFAHLEIPNQTEYIGRSAFYKCMNISGITIPSSVKTIGPFAFFECESLGKTVIDNTGAELYQGQLTLSEGLESIGEKAFFGCKSLKSVSIPNSVTTLGPKIFYNCSELKEVTFGTGLTAISDYCFYNCSSLEKLTLPDNILTIGRYAFRGCTALTELNLGHGVESIGDYAFYACAALESLKLPSNVKRIGNYSFRNCSAIVDIVIPASVTEIGKYAFYGTSKASIYCESESILPLWHSRWNTSYRPVFWGVTLSEDGTYLVSVTKSEENPQYISGAEAPALPTRAGYTFRGFATEQGSKDAVYTIQTIKDAPNGTVLYAIWIEELPEESVSD